MEKNENLQDKSEIESETTISIPYHELLTDREIEYVIKEMKQYL